MSDPQNEPLPEQTMSDQLRERISDAIFWHPTLSGRVHCDALADAVLAVLPDPARICAYCGGPHFEDSCHQADDAALGERVTIAIDALANARRWDKDLAAVRAENADLRDAIARVEAECAGSLDGDMVWVSDIRDALAGTGQQE